MYQSIYVLINSLKAESTKQGCENKHKGSSFKQPKVLGKREQVDLY